VNDVKIDNLLKLLLIETSGDACSCALKVGDRLYERCIVAPRKHAELILNMIDEVLAEARLKPTHLDAIVFGQGPGSFTGLRIACGVAQGIAFAANIPVIAVSSLATLAFQLHQKTKFNQILIFIDARMNEVYCGYYVFEHQHNVFSKESVAPPQNIDIPDTKNWYGGGNAWEKYSEMLTQRLGQCLYDFENQAIIKASDMIPLAIKKFQQGQILSAESALPVYLHRGVYKIPSVKSESGLTE
jgi:tRNA threonylcarbamoyladenosine biosynthesis protein TsaB